MPNRVTIVAFGADGEALALRSLLETLQHDVRLLRVTDASVAAKVMNTASEDDVVIVSAMGDARGFYVGPSAQARDWVSMPAIFKNVQFRNEAVLISTAAAARESGLVDAMFHAGGHLIAPNSSPDRSVVVAWVGACLLRAHAGLAEAVISANTLVEPENRFSYG